MDKIMIGNQSTMIELGYYENAEKIIYIPLSIITALGTIMLPKMSNLIANNKEEVARKYISKGEGGKSTIEILEAHLICTYFKLN